jgi:hypothetical protein
MLSEELHIPKVTIWKHMANSLGLQCRHFTWVSSRLTEDLAEEAICKLFQSGRDITVSIELAAFGHDIDDVKTSGAPNNGDHDFR